MNILYKKMCYHLEDLHDQVNQYFSNDQCKMFTKSCVGEIYSQFRITNAF